MPAAPPTPMRPKGARCARAASASTRRAVGEGRREVAAKAPAKPPSASVLITFVTDSAELAGQARSSLDVIGKALQSQQLANLKFAIEGHADPRGTSEHNLRLSQARAESVVSYLSTQHRIDRSRLRPVGKGDSELYNAQQPTAPENRRVTIARLPE